MTQVLAFLQARRAQAFAHDEIANALSLPSDDVADFLMWLQELGAVESRVLSGEPYYAFTRTIAAVA